MRLTHASHLPLALLTVAAAALASCSPPNAVAPSGSPTRSAVPSASPTPTTAMLVAAGDIAACDEDGDSQTAALVADLEGTVATLGDNVYDAGSDEAYARCYDPAWGRFPDRTRPAIGNHDAHDDGGAAYYRYFGSAAGTPGEGWYSYDVGEWHVVVLNSNCGLVGCEVGSPQVEWLVADLAASDAACTLAYWHHPRFSSGPHGDDLEVTPFWDALADAGADLALVAHDHLYERFAPQTSAGAPDADGLRQITVGTGGRSHYEAERVAPNSEVLVDDAFGVLVLTLRGDGYDWRFLKTNGTDGDAGTAACH